MEVVENKLNPWAENISKNKSRILTNDYKWSKLFIEPANENVFIWDNNADIQRFLPVFSGKNFLFHILF